MDLFEKFSNVAQNVGEEAANAVKSVGDYIKTTNGDQRDMAGLKVQLDMINKKLETYYAAIGKRYVDYVNAPASADAFNVDDIITQMEPLLSLKAETELKISEKEQAIRDAEKEKARAKAQERFEAESKRLENALAMDILTVDEYNEKIAVAKKKYQYYDILRKYEMQFNMQIITKEEYDAKVNELLK